MPNTKMIKKYMQFNKILLATLHTNTKRVEVFDGETNQEFDYRGFFIYVANYFKLNPDFIDKSTIMLESIDKSKDYFEVDDEYKDKNGSSVTFTYHLLKQNENEFLVSVNEEVNDNALNDVMTKAKPKSYIDNRAKNNILSKTPFVLIEMDVDNFKHLNDEYGESVGDMILIEMVSVGKTFLGGKGAIARTGGDRFLVIYDIEDDYDIVHDFLFNFKIQIQKLPVCQSKGINITVTMGCAQYPKDGSYELMQLKCKKALIRGKNKGRDCFIMYLEEKCGPVNINDKIVENIKRINSPSTKNNVYSLITDVNQLLSDERSTDDSVEKAINLVGNYFYIDRISIARLDIKTHKIRKHHIWFNPKISVEYPVYCTDELIAPWGVVLGSKYYVNIDDAKELPDDNPLKKLFEVDHTTATLAFELVVNHKSFGLMRFDMTTGVRHWQIDVFQAFLLISQLFASYFQKNYLKHTNYKTFYLEPIYECNNFTKLFTDAGDAIISDNVLDYSIVEIDIKYIVRYRTIIGSKRTYELVKLIVSSFEKRNLIYGKKHEAAFIVFMEGHDKKQIEELVKEIKENVDRFSESINLLTLELQVGVYFANSIKDSLIDAIGNANLTRILNKNQLILYYSDDIRNKALFKSEMLLRIDEALDNGEFLLYLQPKVSTKTGELMGAEALTRWNYKGERMLFPDQFIPVFEEQGVIDKLDYKVFENVCIYQRDLLNEGKNPVSISVNVSRYVSDLKGYIDNIELIRKKYKIPASLIEIEITEGMYYENSFLISGFIDDLHECGYKVSMDDFGSGYSNLVAMAKLKFDVIKFDKSFCLDLDNENVKVMLDKLIELIKMMKMKTLCEGVETKDNVDYLTKIGCDSIQGYYFSKPIPCDDFKHKYYEKDK